MLENNRYQLYMLKFALNIVKKSCDLFQKACKKTCKHLCETIQIVKNNGIIQNAVGLAHSE